jgi:uncharacterized protein YgbK (DUF1537 family)
MKEMQAWITGELCRHFMRVNSQVNHDREHYDALHADLEKTVEHYDTVFRAVESLNEYKRQMRKATTTKRNQEKIREPEQQDGFEEAQQREHTPVVGDRQDTSDE